MKNINPNSIAQAKMMNLNKIVEAQKKGETVVYQLVYSLWFNSKKFEGDDRKGSISFTDLCIPKKFHGNHLMTLCHKSEPISPGNRVIKIDEHVFINATLYCHLKSESYRLHDSDGFLLLPVPKRISRSLFGKCCKNDT